MLSNKQWYKAAAIAVGLAVVTSASAQVTVSMLPGYNPEFNVTPWSAAGYDPANVVNGGIETFCTDRNAGIILPGLFNYTVSSNGIPQGVAWLYSQFAAGTLPNYIYTPGAGRTATAVDLQDAIWTLQGTYSYPDPTVNLFLDAVADHFAPGDFVTGFAMAILPNAPGGYGVGVLNLTYATNIVTSNGVIPAGTAAQPLLVLLQTPPPPQTNNIVPGDTATIGFWQNKNGQGLIKTAPNSPALGNWLSGNFPCLFGNLAGASNNTVAAYYLTLFKVTGQKTGAQIMCAALACYVTDSSNGVTGASKYGFNIGTGTGGKLYNVGSLGTAIGLSDNTSYSVLQLLQQANLLCTQGFSQSELNALNTIFNDINTSGDIQ